MKKEKVESMFYEELSKIEYEVIGTLTDLKLHSIIFLDTFDDDLFYEFCRFNFREFTRDLTVSLLVIIILPSTVVSSQYISACCIDIVLLIIFKE